MHKRIRELAEQAGLDDADFPIENWDNVPLAKFAELIVKECAGIVDNYGRWILYDKLAVKIKKHFGVEE